MADYGDAMMRNPNAAVQARTKAQNRANVMQLKLIGQGHPTGLTANLLKLFEPRPPLEYKPPPEKRKCLPYAGVAQFVKNFAEPGDPEYAPPVQKGETFAERRARIHQIRLEDGAKKAAEELEKYDPNNNPNISGDPYKTLFVARLNYESTESRIKREFEAYGPIKRVGFVKHQVWCLGYFFGFVMDKETNKPRGYAFIEYLHTRDMKAAYKQADGKKIDNGRVLVDVERGRTVPNWRPRRLGGGLGTTRIGNEDSSLKPLGSAQPGVVSRSEEPRVERDREKSHERGGDRDREREKSRELSHDRPRDREHRDDRHHRDRDRNRERDREHDRSRNSDRDRDHDRDRARDRVHREGDRGREHDKERKHDRHRDRDRKRDRDYEVADDRDRGRSHDREYDYEQDRGDSKHDRGKRQRKYDINEAEDAREWAGHGQGHGEPKLEPDGHYNYNVSQGRGVYNKHEDHGGYGGGYQDNDPYGQADDAYGYDPDAPDQRDHDYRRSERSRSRDYEY